MIWHRLSQFIEDLHTVWIGTVIIILDTLHPVELEVEILSTIDIVYLKVQEVDDLLLDDRLLGLFNMLSFLNISRPTINSPKTTSIKISFHITSSP
jgi:hypothetical protein